MQRINVRTRINAILAFFAIQVNHPPFAKLRMLQQVLLAWMTANAKQPEIYVYQGHVSQTNVGAMLIAPTNTAIFQIILAPLLKHEEQLATMI